MTERPILFSAPMVRALLAGTKTQTRRVVKLPHNNPLGAWEPITLGGHGCYLDKACTKPDPNPPRTFLWHTRTADTVGCPYGVAGDRLWVRETFKPVASGSIKANGSGDSEGTVRYGFAFRADDAVIWNERTCRVIDPSGRETPPMQFRELPWKPGIHMPRRACRIVVEVTKVRAERLQQISVEDALAEGVHETEFYDGAEHKVNGGAQWAPERLAYADLWQSLNGPSWDDNPWVWVVEFNRVS